MADKPKHFKQYCAAAAATLGGFSLGNVIGWSAPAEEIVKKLHNASDTEFSWVTSIMTLGAATSQISTAVFMDRIGRKWLMVAMAFPFVAAWLLLAFGMNLYFLYVGRFVCGFCGGTFCVAAPTYIGELAEKRIRGRLGVFFQLMLTIGILVVYCLGEFHHILFICIPLAVIPILTAILLFFLPESPVFLYKLGKTDKAKAALQSFRGKEFDIGPEMKEIEQYTKEGDEKFWDTFKKKATVKGFLMLLGMHMIQQLSGINAVMFYAHKIFEMAGASLSAGINAIILGTVQVLVTGVSAYIVDKAGRKLLWLISLSIMAICLGILGGYFIVKATDEEFSQKIAFVPLLAVCFYLVGFSLGAGPLPWSMIGELLPNRVKGPLGSTAAFINWILAFLVSNTFAMLIDIFGAFTLFWVYGAVCAVGIPFILLFTIETKHKTLDEIQTELGS